METTRPPKRSSLDLTQFESRKKSHLDLALDPRAQSEAGAGLERVSLRHDALPELDWSDVDLSTTFLKRKLATPFVVTGMTAGHASARELNRRLARACAKRGWVLGLGSQRRELESESPPIDAWSELGADFPGLPIVGNLGIAQAIRADAKALRKLVANSGSTAFALHLNSLQEAIQPEGTPQFRGGLAAIRKLARSLGAPLILKETGCGFSERTLAKLREIPLLAVDVSGRGGTHWGRIEGLRADSQGARLKAAVAETFRGWGIPTVESVIAARKRLRPATEIWASGGVRTGLDAAKLIALGAARVGFAKPALENAVLGEAELDAWMERIETELRTAMFCMGYASVRDLRVQALKRGDVAYDG